MTDAPWQALVPMGGSGQRFRDAGYDLPKPLIDVDGRPMIAHVLADLAGCERVICAVRAEHLQQTPIADVIHALRPDAQIVAVPAHKDGPVRTLLDAAHAIDRDLPLLVHYADYATGWNFEQFRQWCAQNQWQAALDAYTGTMPHLGGPTRYAGLRTDGERVLEIREKHCFAATLREGWHSAGSYWVRRAGDLLDSAQQVIDADARVAGEHFVSTALGRLVAQGLKTGRFPLQFFHQWGTPEDLRAWQAWQRGMAQLDQQIRDAAQKSSRSAQLLLMAGRGNRFAAAGERLPKPFVPVAGGAMVAQGLALLPQPTLRLVVARTEHLERLRGLQLDAAPLQVLALDAVTAGQAISADLGLAQLPEHTPVLIAPCDAGHVLDLAKWQALETRDDVDLVVFTAPLHQPALWHPQSYGWADVAEDGRVRAIAVKQPIAGVPLAQQQVLTGQFWTPDAARLRAAIHDLVAADERVNGEFYLDSVAGRLVAQGARVWALPVTLWLSWGTPQEVADFHYWNALFRQDRPLGAG
jgi:NDP-sugar pyrophosphorylase family protein